MPKIYFQHQKKGKVAPNVQDSEPDGDTPAQEREEGNTSAPGPKTTQKGIKAKSLKKATSAPDAAEASEAIPDAEDGVEESNERQQGSDKAKVSKPKAKVGADANAGPTPAKGKARFGRPGSPIQF